MDVAAVSSGVVDVINLTFSENPPTVDQGWKTPPHLYFGKRTLQFCPTLQFRSALVLSSNENAIPIFESNQNKISML